MRITNNMINDKASMNINGNKINVDADNTRMTTQKKIDRPSEDPVIAIRSLRLQTSLTKINQYYEKNIPDADSWMDVTETALLNIRDIMTDVRTLCVKGSTDTLTEDDRKIIYTQLKSLQQQCFAEGNADYAGRTVFTGFRTDKTLVFMNDDANTTYDIQEPMQAVNMEKSRFYTNEVEIPTNPTDIVKLDLSKEYKEAADYIESNYDDYSKVSYYNTNYRDKVNAIDGYLSAYPWMSTINDSTADGDITNLVNRYITDPTAAASANTAAQYIKANYTDYAAGKAMNITTNMQVHYNKINEYLDTYDWSKEVINIMGDDGTNYADNDAKSSAINDLVNAQIAADSSESSDMSIEESDYYKLRLSYNLNNRATTTDSVQALNFYTKNRDDSLTQRNSLDLTKATEMTGSDSEGVEFAYTELDVYKDSTTSTLTDKKTALTEIRDNYEKYQSYLEKVANEETPDSDEIDAYNVINGYLPEFSWAVEANPTKSLITDATTDEELESMFLAHYPEASIQKVYQFENEADWAAWSKAQKLVVYKKDETTGDDTTDIDEEATKAAQKEYYDSCGVKFDEDPDSPTYLHPINKFVPNDAIVIIKNTSDIIYGQGVATALMTDKVDLSFDYQKKGFEQGELRPEYYFDSTLIRDADGNLQGKYHEDTEGKYSDNDKTSYDGIVYDRYDKSYDDDGNLVLKKKALYSLDYTISQNQTLGVNLEAEECFNQDIYQDMCDMIDAVSKAQAAHDKVDKIKDMQKEDQYQAEPYASKLAGWLEITQKEADYYDNNLSKLYSATLGKVDTYLSKINLSITDIGCRTDQLKLTEKRMSDQQETVEELKSKNDDMDLSQIIMDYTSSYTAYQSSLVAAGRLGQQTLFNYI